MDEAALTTALAAEEAAEAALAVEAVLSESEDEAVITAAQHDANGCEGEGAPPGSTRAPRKRNPAPKRGGTPSRAPTDGAQDDACGAVVAEGEEETTLGAGGSGRGAQDDAFGVSDAGDSGRGVSRDAPRRGGLEIT